MGIFFWFNLGFYNYCKQSGKRFKNLLLEICHKKLFSFVNIQKAITWYTVFCSRTITHLTKNIQKCPTIIVDIKIHFSSIWSFLISKRSFQYAHKKRGDHSSHLLFDEPKKNRRNRRKKANILKKHLAHRRQTLEGSPTV